MQDIHAIGSGGGGGGGRLFGGGGDRRLRSHHHQQGHAHQALKCPRCESLNTKFCYYNNYNLSQPRHFCKSCRRYWTKGGVLRNVPVGGGCRKTKRSKPKTSSNNNQTSDAGAPARERKSSNSQNSSSDSSSLTANTSAAKTTATTRTPVTEVLSGSNSTNSSRTLFNFQESSTRFFNIPQTCTPNQSFEPPMLENSSADNIFPEIGPFTSMMTSSNDQLPLGFNMARDISSFRLQQQGQVQGVEYQNSNEQQWVQQTESMMGDEEKMQEMSGGGFMDDHSCQIELSGLQNRTSNGGLSTDDWQGGTDQGLFDLTGTVDQSYWNQNQWNDQDHQFNFLP